MHLEQRSRNIKSLTRMLRLRGNAARPHTREQLRQLIGEGGQIVVDGVILHTLEDLVVTVQPTPEPVMGTPPHPRTELGIILAALPGRREKRHAEL